MVGQVSLRRPYMIEPKPLIGSSAQSCWEERLRQQLRSQRLLPGRGYRLKPTPGGVYLELDQVGGSHKTTVAGPKTYQIGELHGDYYVAYPWNGGGFDTDSPTKIAKPFRLRNSILAEVLGGITYNYTYDALSTVVRSTTWLVSGILVAQTDAVEPQFLGSDLITVAEVDYTGVTVDDTLLTLMDLNVDGLRWLRKYYQ